MRANNARSEQLRARKKAEGTGTGKQEEASGGKTQMCNRILTGVRRVLATVPVITFRSNRGERL